MKTPEDLPTPPQASPATIKDDMAARLAEIKKKAAEGAPVTGSEDMDEEQILAEAARGLAERRTRRGDLIGTLIWETIAAGGAACVGLSQSGADRSDDLSRRRDFVAEDDNTDRVVPAHWIRRDRRNDDDC